MNKIYKSIYNAVRGTWVVVSEATSSYKQPSKSVMDSEVCCAAPNATAKAIASAVVAACLMMGSGHSFAAPSRSESFYVGGIEISGYSNTFTGYETNLSIYSGSAQSQETNWSFRTSSTAGQHFDHSKYDPYTDIDLSGAHWNSLADGGTGSFVHDTNKTVQLRSGSNYLFKRLATHMGNASIINEGSGKLHFEGNKDKEAIYEGVYGGTLSIENRASGSIYFGISSIVNYVFADVGIAKEEGYIRNLSNGEITFQGYLDSSAIFSNQPYAIQYFVCESIAESGGLGIIENSGVGSINFLGHSIFSLNQYGWFEDSSDNKKGQAKIINSGGGKILISSQAEKQTNGENCGNAIEYMGMSFNGNNFGNTTTILNKKGIMVIEGDERFGTYGINGFAYVTSQIINQDLMYLGANAFGDLYLNNVFQNKVGATVKADARVIFNLSATKDANDQVMAETKQQTITILGKDGQIKTTTVDGYVVLPNEESYPDDTLSPTFNTATIKSDWLKGSSWEAGGHLVITNVAEGTALAKSIRDAFEKQFGTGTDITFKGGVSGIGGLTDFTSGMLDTLIARGDVSNGSVLSDVTFSAGGGEFLVGTNGINQDIGFMGIKNASAIKVTDGKTLTLTGGVTNTRMAGEDIPIVLQNGTLQLGDTRLAAGEGIIGSIATDAHSTVDVAHGHFTLQNVTGNGHIEVGDQGNVTLNTFSTTVNNLGVLNTVGDVTINAVDKSKSKALQYAFRNQGIATLKGVTVTEGAELRNVKDGKVTAGAVKLNAGSELTNLGTMTVDSLTGWGTIRNKGTLNVNGQLFVPGQTTQVLAGTVSAGDLVIGETSQPQEASLLALNPTGTLMIQGQTFAKNMTFNSGNVQVVEGGTLTQGMDKDAFEKFEKEHKDLVKDKTVLVVDKNFSMGENDSLWVAEDLSDKNLALGDKSLVVLTGNNLKGHAMFESKDGSQLSASIAQGAQFVFDGDVLGRHYIAKGFDEASMEAFKDLTITDLENNKIMDVMTNQNGVFVVNGTDDISTIAPNALFKDAFNYLLDGHQGVGNTVLTKYLDKLLTSDDQKITTETTKLAQVASIAGVQQQGLSRHQMMTESVFGQHYRNTGSVLWATAMGSDGEVEDLSIGNGVQTSFDVKNYGAMVGVDLPITNDLMMGAAVGYMKSDIKPQGFKNEVESVGASLYGAARFNKVRVKGALGYSQGDNEVKGALLDSILADVKTNVASAELIGQMDFGLGRTLVSPYVGVRGLWVKTDDYATKIGGQEAIQNETEDEIFAQVPVGVELTHVFGTPSGWAVQGHANLGAVYTFGDRTVENIVKADGSTDKIESEVMEELQGKATLGLSVSSKHSRMDLGYSYSQGGMTKSHAIKANMRWVF